MKIVTLPVNIESLTEYSTLPSRFEVKSRLSVELLNDGFGGVVLNEEVVSPTYIKNYDTLDGEGPIRWVRDFNTTNWVIFLAREGNVPIGGATIAFRTPEVFMLGGRDDIAVVWDIRVKPDYHRSGVGSSLFTEATKWAKERGCKYLKVETQNVNVPACRFYVNQGCRLGEINRFAYTNPRLVNEVMLVWYREL